MRITFLDYNEWEICSLRWGVLRFTFYYWQKRLREDVPTAGFIQVAEPVSYTEVEIYIENIGWLATRK